MKTPRFVNAISYIDDDLILGAVKITQKPKSSWRKWRIIAACFIVVFIASVAVLPWLLNDAFSDTKQIDGRYKDDIEVEAVELGYEWPWELLTVYEQYPLITVDNKEYRGRQREVPISLIGDKIGSFKASSKQLSEDEQIHNRTFEVFEMANAPKENLVAVKMEDRYYVFIAKEHNPPQTLGEVFNDYALSKTIELSRFAIIEKNSLNSEFTNYALYSDDYIWEILNSCANAQVVDPLGWSSTERDHLSFTITSEELGVYKRVMYVTEDGYLWTNVFDQAFLYYIGEEQAEKIISFAKNNSEETKFEPFYNTITGEIVEITDEYILVDDSILCKDSADGINFKILLNDLRISRYVSVSCVGEVVQVSFEGNIDEKNGYVIDSAVSVLSARIISKDGYSGDSSNDNSQNSNQTSVSASKPDMSLTPPVVTDSSSGTSNSSNSSWSSEAGSNDNTSSSELPPTVAQDGLMFALLADNTYEVADIYYNLPDDVVIPETINGLKVTSLGDYVFSYCGSITSVTLPNSITRIGNSSFEFCKSLTSIEIPNSVESIGELAFWGCKSLESVTLGNNVQSIGAGAFLTCEALTSITIPDSVQSIDNTAFASCTSLQSVTLGKNVQSIGEHTFSICKSLTSIVIPNSIQSIGSSAFYGCDSLVEVYNLSNLDIKKGSDSNGYVAYYAFDVYTDKNALSKLSTDENGFVIHTSASNEKSLIAYQGAQTEIEISAEISYINGYAFKNCSQIKSIAFEEGSLCEGIGRYAFYKCTSLESITLPSSINMLDIGVFNGCSSLKTAVLPNSVTSISNYLFSDCSALESVTMGNSVISIGESAFYRCASLESIDLPNSLTTIEKSAFSGCALFENIVLPEQVTSIGNYVFKNCTALKSVTIGTNVTRIGAEAFNNCTSLESITFKDASTWYCTELLLYIGGAQIDVSNSSLNATNFTSTYVTHCWYKE